MVTKSTKSTALVPAGQRKAPARSRTPARTVMPATADTLLPILRSDLAVAKLVGTGGDVTREEGVFLVTGRGYATSAGIIPAGEIYYDRASRPESKGEWLDEADKVSWRDEVSGYDCIMLRDRRRGFLSGYVGIPRDHPLWGWEHDAVPSDLGIEIHGGLTYSRVCQHGPSPTPRLIVEAARICHVRAVPPPRFEPLRHATDHRVEDADAWWLGFSCDHAYDLVPGDGLRSARQPSSELAQTYRDDAYVFRETIALAAQLRAIADGEEAPPRDGSPPPVGLDPRRGGGRG